MPPELALILGCCLIMGLLRMDSRWRSPDSKAVLIVILFLGVIGSRPVSYWFGSGSEGNPANTVFFGLMIIGSVAILQARRIEWSSAFWNNKSLFLLYFFFAISSILSEEPTIALRRLTKDFACVLVALVVLTERDPAASLRLIAVRVSYILFPLSLVFGKYYPAIGRNFSMGGEPMFTGVTMQKNSLGEIVFVLSLMLLWDVSELIKRGAWRLQTSQVMARLGILALGVWLLLVCDSKTSLVCLIVGALLFFSRSRFRRWRGGKAILVMLLFLSAGLVAFDKSLGISEVILTRLNRDTTFTGRTDIWDVVLRQQTNPVMGGGFYLFWDGEKGDAVARELIRQNSAHSGYIETYLDGGIIGCILLGLFLLVMGGRAIRNYFSDGDFAAIALSFWVTTVVYNMSESSFFRLDPLWFLLLLVGIEPARQAVRIGDFRGAVLPSVRSEGLKPCCQTQFLKPQADSTYVNTR